MRRKDREILDTEKIKTMITSCQCCRLGLNDEGQVYIVPLNFGYTELDGVYTFYFHGAKEGRKIDLIRKNNNVGFELDTNYKLNISDVACGYSARFQSVIGTGKITFVTTKEEKNTALLEIMRHCTGKKEWEFSEDMLNSVCVFKLSVDELSCKEHL